jgi:hypothetical protein
MIRLVLDFETYFDGEYTLKKLTTEAYIRDPRFEAHGVGLYFPDTSKKFWVPQEQVRAVFDGMDWSKIVCIAHHAQFDGLILSHHYGKRPAFWICTMAAARAVRGTHEKASLAALAGHFGLLEKSVPYAAMQGYRWAQMDPWLKQTLGDGCLHDCELTWAIAKQLLPALPALEYDMIDLTVRMFTEPALQGDVPLLNEIVAEEVERKQALLDELGVTAADLQSADKFVALLEAEGVEIEYKDGKKGPIPAIAATDDFMKGLVDHGDERISTLASARLDVKSTIGETRAGRLGAVASRGSIPVYLNYCGAHTMRWSGGDRLNLQNLPRGSQIRSSIVAPCGYVLSIVDAAQIEARVLAAFAGQWDVVEAFETGSDLYADQASVFYGRPINKRDNPTERHLGKVLVLACGYGMGAEKLRVTCKRGALGGPPILLDDGQAAQAIAAYRTKNPQIVALWKTAGRMISAIAGTADPVQWEFLTVTTGRITFPTGQSLKYDDLQSVQNPETGYWEWTYRSRSGRTRIYSGKLVENCLSATTKVLTIDGWKYITEVTRFDLLWDGVEWVPCSGVIAKGVAPTGVLDGVRMTGDHKVLTEYGWVRATQAKGLYRAEVRLPGSSKGCRDRRAEADMGGAVCVRQAPDARHWTNARQNLLRLQELRSSEETQDPRDVPAPSIRGVEEYDGSLPFTDAQSLAQLWWERHLRGPSLAEVSEFLGRHGAYISARLDPGASGQRERLFSTELRLGGLDSTGAEHEEQPRGGHAVGQNDSERSGEPFGAWDDHVPVSPKQQLAPGQIVYAGKIYEPVFDILNAGPRHRFVVAGEFGLFIVHNCVQWLARMATAEAMARVKKAGIKIATMSHDETVCVLPLSEAQAQHEFIIEQMRKRLNWLPKCPLNAEGVLSERYVK